MKNERNEDEIDAIYKSTEPASIEDVTAICAYFGINGSSKNEILHMNEFGVPKKTIIDALRYGENKVNAFGGDPELTGISMGDKNGKYAIIVIGDCGKTTDITAAYQLTGFRPTRNSGKY